MADVVISPRGLSGAGMDVRRLMHLAGLIGIVAGPLLLQVLSFTRVGRTIRLTDEYFYYVHARSWYFDHDCDYENDMLAAPGFDNAPYYVQRRTPTGYVFNHFQTGTAIVSVPLIALADGVTALHNAVGGSPLPRDGYSAGYQFIVSMGHTLLGVIGLLAGYRLAARYFPPHIAAAAVFCMLFGTPAMYYIGYESTLSHAASVGWVGLVLLTTDTIRRTGFSVGRLARLGVFVGMMAITRPQDVLWAVVPVIVLPGQIVRAWKQVGNRRSVLWGVAIGAVLTGACYVPQAIVNLRHFGEPIVNTYELVSVRGRPALLAWGSPDLLRPITHPRTGLLRTAPLALVGIAGIAGIAVASARASRRSAAHAALAIGFALNYCMVSCIWWDFSGYGHRYLVSSTIAFALGLAAVFVWAGRQRWRLGVIAAGTALCLAWQVQSFVGIVFAG